MLPKAPRETFQSGAADLIMILAKFPLYRYEVIAMGEEKSKEKI